MKTLYRLYLNSRRDLGIACCHVSCGQVNWYALTTSWQTLLMEESNFLENVEKQMRKSRVKSPMVSKSPMDSSLVQCKTRFVQIFHIFFLMKHIFVDPLPNLVPRSHSVLRCGRSGYDITYPLLTHSLNYL